MPITKMPISRRRFSTIISATLPLFAVTSRRAEAATFHYKCATNLPAIHPLNVRLTQAAERLKAQRMP